MVFILYWRKYLSNHNSQGFPTSVSQSTLALFLWLGIGNCLAVEAGAHSTWGGSHLETGNCLGPHLLRLHSSEPSGTIIFCVCHQQQQTRSIVCQWQSGPCRCVEAKLLLLSPQQDKQNPRTESGRDGTGKAQISPFLVYLTFLLIQCLPISQRQH